MEFQGAFNAAFDAATGRLRVTFDPDAANEGERKGEAQGIMSVVTANGTAIRVVRV